MAEYDSNMIKPVEGLQNVTGLTPARRREERRHRKQLGNKNDEKNEILLDEIEDEQLSDDRQDDWSENCDSNSNKIDFRA